MQKKVIKYCVCRDVRYEKIIAEAPPLIQWSESSIYEHFEKMVLKVNNPFVYQGLPATWFPRIHHLFVHWRLNVTWNTPRQCLIYTEFWSTLLIKWSNCTLEFVFTENTLSSSWWTIMRIRDQLIIDTAKISKILPK